MHVQHLSGQELREIIGHATYTTLNAAASESGETINSYCLQVLREQLKLDLSYDKPAEEYTAPAPQWRSVAHATFKGGESEPLHRWYPYLEGYSPQFVEGILDEYAPNAHTVLDPFGGTGTTPLTASRRRRQAYYCEINPLLQYLVRVKVDVLSLPVRRRMELAEKLEWFATGFDRELDRCSRSADLSLAYSGVFGHSQFFDEDTYDSVLRSRNLIDELACTSPITADLLTIAVLASLVPSSLLTRAGDLRFKTDRELSRERVYFHAQVREQLLLMGSDLRLLDGFRLPSRPRLIAEDARSLINVPPLAVDVVITSPPYLNGTNYFRNTKLELWFLRTLRSRDDLAAFRSRTITAGINDVSNRRRLGSVHPSVAALVRDLEKVAYDTRIPKMVHGYFQDMTAVFDALSPHLDARATLAIDIGDSAYSGLHVPTDALLADILKGRGFAIVADEALRRRLSRGGRVLRQALLILRRHTVPEAGPASSEAWSPKWSIFKATLPHQRLPYAKRNWGHPLHSLCSYQGKMKPALAAHLIDSLVPEHGTILDPFAGVATIPFEAALSGRRSYGFDISPAALVIGAAKLGRVSDVECAALIERLSAAIRDDSPSEADRNEAYALGFNGHISDYFHPKTLEEVLIARQFFLDNPPNSPSSSLVMACLLHILHGNRPYALSRRSHPITPFAPTGEFEYRALLPRLVDKVERSLRSDYPDGFVDGTMLYQDATSWWPRHIQNLDAIVTSPPFYDSTRFYSANWMRLWFAGWGRREFEDRPLLFVDERQKQDFNVYESLFRQARERLKRGGLLALHLGKSVKCDMAQVLGEIARPWFRIADRFTEDVSHCESHGIRDKGTVESHQYLILSD